MVPGTGSYAITPKGAAKMLDAIERCGLDQSDYMLNSFNVNLNYCNCFWTECTQINV